MGALARNMAAREHVFTAEHANPRAENIEGEKNYQWHLAGASGCDVIPVALNLIKTCQL